MRCRLLARHHPLAVAFVFIIVPAFAQTPVQTPAHSSSHSSPTDVTCKPVALRASEADLGCWVLSDQPVGPLTQTQAFWHLDTFPTLDAANAAKGAGGTILTSLGKVWLLTLAEASWRAPAGARHIATIGPLPLSSARQYAAQYMEATFTPGTRTVTHAHPGIEAFYTTTGAVCLETPAGISFGRAGNAPVIIPEGIPMQLTAIGTETRRSLVLILHDAAMPAVHPVHDWTPKGLCTT